MRYLYGVVVGGCCCCCFHVTIKCNVILRRNGSRARVPPFTRLVSTNGITCLHLFQLLTPHDAFFLEKAIHLIREHGLHLHRFAILYVCRYHLYDTRSGACFLIPRRFYFTSQQRLKLKSLNAHHCTLVNATLKMQIPPSPHTTHYFKHACYGLLVATN